MSHTPLLGPLDGEDNDTPVVEVIHGESCVAKQHGILRPPHSCPVHRGLSHTQI